MYPADGQAYMGTNGEINRTWHSSRASQFHKTLNGENQSGSFRDMHSTISGPSFEKFWAHGQAHMGQMGKWPWLCTNTGLDNSIELWMEKICPVVSETSLPTPSDMTILHQLKGLRGKMICGFRLWSWNEFYMLYHHDEMNRDKTVQNFYCFKCYV